jgi:membrane-bound lytic murein transglycosylase B
MRLNFFLSFAFIVGLLLAPAAYLFAQATPPQKSAAELEAELNGVNEEIKGLNNTIVGLQGEKASLGRDINLLSANINKANLNIKGKNLQITKLGDNIKEKTRTVETLSQRLERERQSLAQLIRKTNEIDQLSLAEMVLSNEDLSAFFIDLDSFDSIRAGLKSSSDALKSARAETEEVQRQLEEKQDQELDAKAELERSKRLVEQNEKQKQQLLSITKNKEKQYQVVLGDRKKRAAEIRVALFALRDTGEIQFGQALDYANVVSAKTGVRPAFLLAVFQQESSFGKNQGSCVLKDQATGAGMSVKSGRVMERVMKPDRDVPPFLVITKNTGRDPFNTRVSCPQEVGWGGAMGAAQFIPSTWVMYEGRVAAALGVPAADPWLARDAFMAAGMYLTDIGARSGSYSAERDAACRYFSGKKCSQSSWASTYGNQVMQRAETIQSTMIDPLQNT